MKCINRFLLMAIIALNLSSISLASASYAPYEEEGDGDASNYEGYASDSPDAMALSDGSEYSEDSSELLNPSQNPTGIPEDSSAAGSNTLTDQLPSGSSNE